MRTIVVSVPGPCTIVLHAVDTARAFALAAESEASAAVDSARANVAQAQLNLDWSRVNSPITGVVGIALAQVGDLVNPQTIMTTVSRVDYDGYGCVAAGTAAAAAVVVAQFLSRHAAAAHNF